MSVVPTATALPVSVVADTLKPNERKTMSYQYNPDVTELRQAWEVAYGDMGAYLLIGAMFVNLEPSAKENLYKQALDKVREDMEEKGLV